MAHYDCSNCGASMGINFGMCNSCTPKEIFDADKKLQRANIEAVQRWDDLVRELRHSTIESWTRAAREERERVYDRLDPRRQPQVKP